METVRMKLVTIIAEAVLRERLLEDIRELGATGYSLNEVVGEGTRGMHAVDWEGRNLKLETIVAPEVSDRILEHLASDYFTHYAVIAYATNVEVVRPEKYRGP